MARRTSRPKVVWLPPDDSNSVGIQDEATNGFQNFLVEATGPNGSTAVGEIPLTIDGSFDARDEATSLADLENSGYRLRRIVGKIWVFVRTTTDATSPFSAIVTGGIIVRRVDPATQASLALLVGDEQNVAPSSISSWGDPWIWRRSWFLRNNSAPAGGGPFPEGPESNYGANGGSAVDGPHVDQKTARIVGPEERLFLNLSVTLTGSLDPDPQGIPFRVECFTDLRVLASMRTSTGNRRNASR